MKVEKIGAFEAKTHLSQLIERARQGTVFILTRHGKPVAQLGPTELTGDRPVFGSEKGRIRINPDFNEPLPDMAEYEG